MNRSTRAARALTVSAAMLPGLASAAILLDRLEVPWANTYAVPFGTEVFSPFKFMETVDGASKETFTSFTPRLGNLVDQRLRIYQPRVVTEGTGIIALPLSFAETTIRHTLEIKYLLDPFGAVSPIYAGSIAGNCLSAFCPPGNFPFRLSGIFRSGPFVPPGDLAAPGFGGTPPFFVQLTSTIEDALPGVSFSAASLSTAELRVGVYREYEPKSTVEYIRDALNEVRGRPGFSDKQKGVEAYHGVIGLRVSDEVTSAQNLSLRDAEYFLRGYAGGRTVHDGGLAPDDLGNELANLAGPAATAIYNALKWIRGSLGTPLDEGLPGTPVGGFGANAVGWNWGIEGKSVDDVLGILAGLPHLPDVRLGLSVDPASPLTPSVRTTVIAGDIRIDMDLFEISLSDLASLYWFDPQPTPSYALTAVGNRITEVQLAGGLAGDDVHLRFSDRDLVLDPAVGIDLTAYESEGVEALFITGLFSNGPPVFGLRFAQSGDTLLGIGAVTAMVVPLPAAWPLFASALMALIRRRAADARGAGRPRYRPLVLATSATAGG